MKTKISGIIFSKDRAMQLDAVLRSFYLHCRDAENISLSVLYRASTPRHQGQYTLLKEEYASRRVSFIQEDDFREDILSFLRQALTKNLSHRQHIWVRLATALTLPVTIKGRYILFLVDDNLFVRDFLIEECAQQLALAPTALGFSLRLGRNTTWCYVVKSPQALPEFTVLPGQILKYNWPGKDYDFSYPLEISSSLYRLDEMYTFIRKLQFKNPNLLEGQMASRWRDFSSKKSELLCFEQSVTFCNPINMVQKVCENPVGTKEEYSNENLAERFESGDRIKVETYHDFIPNACHQEVDLEFININSKQGVNQ